MAGHIQDAIMLLGDSITQLLTSPPGFGRQLTDVYNRKLDVLVRGFGGYNTTWTLPIFEKAFAKRNERQNLPKVQLLTIWFGATDSGMPGETHHVPFEQYKKNLSKFIHMLHDSTSEYYSPETRIILFTPPPVNTHQWIETLRSRSPPKLILDRDFNITKQYAEGVKEVGAEENIPVIDVWKLLYEAAGKKEENLSKYMTDGLHLNAEAYKLVYDMLIKTISEKYPEIHYDNLEMTYPSWDIINDNNYMELLKDGAVRK